jgi:hypothetical protein
VLVHGIFIPALEGITCRCAGFHCKALTAGLCAGDHHGNEQGCGRPVAAAALLAGSQQSNERPQCCQKEETGVRLARGQSTLYFSENRTGAKAFGIHSFCLEQPFQNIECAQEMQNDQNICVVFSSTMSV